MPRRLRRPERHAKLMDELASGDNSVFNTYAELLIFAGALGSFHSRRVEFKKVVGQVNYDVFEGRPEFPAVIECIALSESRSLAVFKEENSETRLTIFEEYACGGLEIISEKMAKGFLPQDAIIDLCKACQTSESVGPEVLRDYDLQF